MSFLNGVEYNTGYSRHQPYGYERPVGGSRLSRSISTVDSHYRVFPPSQSQSPGTGKAGLERGSSGADSTAINSGSAAGSPSWNHTVNQYESFQDSRSGDSIKVSLVVLEDGFSPIRVDGATLSILPEWFEIRVPESQFAATVYYRDIETISAAPELGEITLIGFVSKREYFLKFEDLGITPNCYRILRSRISGVSVQHINTRTSINRVPPVRGNTNSDLTPTTTTTTGAPHSAGVGVVRTPPFRVRGPERGELERTSNPPADYIENTTTPTTSLLAKRGRSWQSEENYYSASPATHRVGVNSFGSPDLGRESWTSLLDASEKRRMAQQQPVPTTAMGAGWRSSDPYVSSLLRAEHRRLREDGMKGDFSSSRRQSNSPTQKDRGGAPRQEEVGSDGGRGWYRRAAPPTPPSSQRCSSCGRSGDDGPGDYNAQVPRAQQQLVDDRRSEGAGSTVGRKLAFKQPQVSELLAGGGNVAHDGKQNDPWSEEVPLASPEDRTQQQYDYSHPHSSEGRRREVGHEVSTPRHRGHDDVQLGGNDARVYNHDESPPKPLLPLDVASPLGVFGRNRSEFRFSEAPPYVMGPRTDASLTSPRGSRTVTGEEGEQQGTEGQNYYYDDSTTTRRKGEWDGAPSNDPLHQTPPTGASPPGVGGGDAGIHDEDSHSMHRRQNHHPPTSLSSSTAPVGPASHMMSPSSPGTPLLQKGGGLCRGPNQDGRDRVLETTVSDEHLASNRTPYGKQQYDYRRTSRKGADDDDDGDDYSGREGEAVDNSRNRNAGGGQSPAEAKKGKKPPPPAAIPKRQVSSSVTEDATSLSQHGVGGTESNASSTVLPSTTTTTNNPSTATTSDPPSIKRGDSIVSVSSRGSVSSRKPIPKVKPTCLKAVGSPAGQHSPMDSTTSSIAPRSVPQHTRSNDNDNIVEGTVAPRMARPPPKSRPITPKESESSLPRSNTADPSTMHQYSSSTASGSSPQTATGVSSTGSGKTKPLPRSNTAGAGVFRKPPPR